MFNDENKKQLEENQEMKMENEVNFDKDKKPKKKKLAKPSWVKMKQEEFEKIVVDLAKEGNGLAKVGLILRDKHGIPKSNVYGKKIKDILKEKNVKYASDKEIVENKIRKLREHIKKNKHDHTSTRALTKKLWVLHYLEQAV